MPATVTAIFSSFRERRLSAHCVVLLKKTSHKYFIWNSHSIIHLHSDILIIAYFILDQKSRIYFLRLKTERKI